MKEFGGRVAVVTGAASGIGRALAERLAAERMRVVLADVDEKTLAAAERALRERGAETLSVPTDVSRPGDVEALAQSTLDAFGGVHVVCNNAGVAGEFGPVWEQPLEAWEWVLGVNLWGVIHGIRSFVPIMLEAGEEGHVVNTASMAGLVSVPMVSVYHATKHAVVTLSESLHYELTASGARVGASVLCPGFVRTAIIDAPRNRPAELEGAQRTPEHGAAVREAYRRACAEGLDPGQVADLVLDAIREGRFWVFPHPEALEAFGARADAIRAQRNPALADLGDFSALFAAPE